jgi:hypothetical protein
MICCIPELNIPNLISPTDWTDDNNMGHDGILYHHGDITDQEILIIEQLTCEISDVMYFYEGPNNDMPIHVDGGNRTCAINIPVSGNFDECTVSFWHTTTNVESPYDDSELEANKDAKTLVYDPETSIKMLTTKYCRPVLINTSIPHNFKNPTDDPKIILSIGLTKPFAEILMSYYEGTLLSN